MLRRRFFALLPALAWPAARGAGRAAGEPWELLRSGGHVILMRHAATVPGVGDPAGFTLADCGTQRNLSEEGRLDAGKVGAAFRRRAVPLGEVLSSRWCRCVDTAQLAFGRVQPATMLDSMFNDDRAARERKLAQLRTYLASRRAPGNTVLVTHDVNIRALVAQYVEPGSIVIASPAAGGELTIKAVATVADLIR